MGGQSSKVTGGHWSAPGQSRHFDRGAAPSGLPRSTDIVRPPGMSGWCQMRK
jgi:hypothetical protein